MRLSNALIARPGLSQAVVLMATPANLAALAESDLALPATLHLSPNDLLMAVTGTREAEIEAALDWAEAELRQPSTLSTQPTRNEPVPRTLAEGLHLAPQTNLAIISVPGEYAYGETLKGPQGRFACFPF